MVSPTGSIKTKDSNSEYAIYYDAVYEMAIVYEQKHSRSERHFRLQISADRQF
jgi:hypothetical protein